jgi:hypothetical protein
MRTHRRGYTVADTHEDYSCRCCAGSDFRRHLRVHTIVDEFIYALTFYIFVGSKDRPGLVSSRNWSRVTYTTGAR